MKQTLLILLISIFFINCNPQETHLENEHIESIRINTHNQIKEYLDEVYPKFDQAINESSGILGWKNVRDYFKLGKETMDEKSSRIWYSVYDSIQVHDIIRENIEEGRILLDKDTKNINIEYISAKKEIKLYSHKIGLSVVGFIFEEFVEFVVNLFFGSVFVSFIVFCFVFYMFTFGGWIRWSKKRRKKVDNIAAKTFKWVTRVFFIGFFIYNWMNGDFTENQLKEKIENSILNKVNQQIIKNLK